MIAVRDGSKQFPDICGVFFVVIFISDIIFAIAVFDIVIVVFVSTVIVISSCSSSSSNNSINSSNMVVTNVAFSFPSSYEEDKSHRQCLFLNPSFIPIKSKFHRSKLPPLPQLTFEPSLLHLHKGCGSGGLKCRFRFRTSASASLIYTIVAITSHHINCH